MTDSRCVSFLGLSARRLRGIALVLLTVLVIVQTAGMLHRVAHAHAHGTRSVVAVEGASAASFGQHLMAGLQHLWGDHSHAVDCQLFDQNCPDALHTPVWVFVPEQHAHNWLSATLRERFALFERFYAARGPPAVLL